MEREPIAPYTQEDWDEVSDSPTLTEADFKRARPVPHALPGLVEGVTRRRGRPKSEARKVQVNLRIDPDVLEAYKAAGPGWQTRMNAALRAGVSTADDHAVAETMTRAATGYAASLAAVIREGTEGPKGRSGTILKTAASRDVKSRERKTR